MSCSQADSSEVDLGRLLYAGGSTTYLSSCPDTLLSLYKRDLLLRDINWKEQKKSLPAGDIIIFFLGLHECGGWTEFSTTNADKLHMILAADHEGLPWTGVFSGMWIVIIYYCGLNQFIVQRNLAAKTLRDGQLGVIFAGALWLIVPFAIVMPGIMSNQLYGEQMAKADEAFPLLIRNLVPDGLRGFMFAAIAGAVISSLASMLNSASTIFTMDIYNRMLDRNAPQRRLLLLGHVLTIVFALAGCSLAPMINEWEKFKGIFDYIQRSQKYIWPGVVAAFLFGMMVPKALGLAAVAALISGPVIYGMFQTFVPELHFLIQVAITFLLVLIIMGLITFLKPLGKPRELPVREDIEIKTMPEVKLAGALVLAAVAVF